MGMSSSLIRNDGTAVVTVLFGGEVYVADDTHPNFDAIVEGIEADDESVVDLFDVANTVSKEFNKYEALSERVSVANGRVYLDGDEFDTSLTQQIVRVLNEGGDFESLVLFLENLLMNPKQQSVEQLYNWLKAAGGFTITADGKIVGYKAVQEVGDGTYRSIHGGRALVNGEVKEGQIPQAPGDVVTMPRSEVKDDPNAACHQGLHVGTFAFAKDFGGNTPLLEVHVNPRDVVSVPRDASAQKMRVCQYEVVGQIDAPYKTAVVPTAAPAPSFDGWGDGEGFDDDEDYCDDCGEYVDDCECDDEQDFEPAVSAPVAARPKPTTVSKGDKFEDRHPRANGRVLTVAAVDKSSGVATVESSTTGKVTQVATANLLSRKFRPV